MTRLLLLLALSAAPAYAKDAPKPPPKEEPRKPEPSDCNRTASCRCNDPAWDGFSPCDPNPHAVRR